MAGREREGGLERKRFIGHDDPLDGEQFVDGTGGGSENTVDSRRESPESGPLVGMIVTIVLALVLVALPLAWALGVITLLGPASSDLAWVYALVIALLGLAAAFFALTLLRARLR